MVANKTASGCAEQPVVSGVMAGDATDDGAFDAASRVRRVGKGCRRNEHHGHGEKRLHCVFALPPSVLFANRNAAASVPTTEPRDPLVQLNFGVVYRLPAAFMC